ncbi:MAG TPA: hypothetical protein VLY65_01350 [Nitrososphaerales archaeon]|nr:hypothetical protein [Nitrososphaerales archaeon]
MASRLLLYASGTIAVLGGLLMFLGGVTSHSLVLWILPMLQQEVLTRLPAPIETAARVAVDIIALLVSLGGITVVLGGLALLLGRRSTGRTLIALGGAAGVLGLSLALGYTVLVSGLGSVGPHAGYWVGVAVAVVARRLARV